MIDYLTYELAEIVDSKKTITHQQPLHNISIDSRTILSPFDTVFFALVGDRNNGHDYIRELIDKGVKVFVISEYKDEYIGLDNICFIEVGNTFEALHKVAIHHRKKSKYPVVGITGSNGKTMVKEWIYQILYNEKNIIRNPKSYNSQVGVPLSICLMDSTHEMGVFEAGISMPGEMEKLERIIHPQIGIFTNIGEAHQENFISISQKIDEKIKLFIHCEMVIYCKDHKVIDERMLNKIEKEKLVCWSINEGADLVVSKTISTSESTLLKGIYNNEYLEINIPFTDKASIENLIHIWLLLLKLGYQNEFIAKRMNILQPVAMRLELKQGINNSTIINDAYNSDINSISIALDFLKQQQQNNGKTVILSDIMQSGRNFEELYLSISKLIEKRNIDKFIGIGENLCAYAKFFKKESKFYKNTEEFLAQVNKDDFNDEAILLKGSRIYEFERISKLLEYKAHRTILEINLSNLVYNLNFFRSKLYPNTKVLVMVKALSYGSGSYEIANVLQTQGVDYLGVAFTDEGVDLRKNGIAIPIIVMQAEERSYENLIEFNLEPEIYSFGSLRFLIRILKRHQIKNFPVHLKFDTGMHRMGFSTEDISDLINLIKEEECIQVKSVFSHLAASDEDIHKEFTIEQIECFKIIRSKFQEHFQYEIFYHILNSEGIIRFREAQFDMVRLGIGLYGVSSSVQDKLMPVSALKSRILQIKHVKEGETIGYNRKGIAHKDKVIGIIPIGYADGLNRGLSNGVGKFYINGKFAPVIGNICMDVCMIDITDNHVKEGDEVIIFGKEIPIVNLANALNTIPYEILSNISSRVKRVYYQE